MSRAAAGISDYQNFGITVDFTQRFRDAEPAAADATMPEAKSSATVTNVMYNITAMYSRSSSKDYNENFGSSLNDVFKYGYIGKFITEKHRNYSNPAAYDYNGVTITAQEQDNWYDEVISFTPYEGNRVLANYTSQLYNTPEIAPYLTNFDAIRAFRGLINGESPNSVYGMFYNVGVQSTDFSFSQTDYFYAQAKVSMQIQKHELELGFQFDRYSASGYSLGAYGLWTLMRNEANKHIQQLDKSRPTVRLDGSTYKVDYDRLYNEQQQESFDIKMREYLGLAKNSTDWIDVDRYSPEDYAKAGGLSMFSSDELFNQGNSYVSYYGFDHTGAKYNGRNWDLDDFFNPASKGHDGYRYLPAFSPTYLAGYIQDKFYFQDLIFNVGVRVDYFDGNQYVLKDPYLLYESYTVGDLRNNKAAFSGELYSGAGDSWTPYVDDASSANPTIKGYRNGSVWYDANGVEVTSPSKIAGISGKPTPYRTPAGMLAASNNTVGKEAFQDYKPQVVVMPRIAFSFPVGDNSQFKASFDIIARRPSSGWQANYLSYLYMSQISTVSNPNLKPERITNYEVGFQQALNTSSAISISAYYKETRDLIQLVQYAGADPNVNYYSYDNIDFKTIKGFTLAYDLRQTKNIRINANYTLQYAEGTGLSSTTMTELIKEGYTTLKMLNPISDDRRHEFKVNLDFRYGHGSKYNGPTITSVVTDKETGEKRKKEVKVLEDFGVNIMAVAQSGRPYTKAFSNTQSTIVGSYRGARLPWSFFFDLVIDKSWCFKVGKRDTYFNVALTVSNLFDIRNVKNVFPVTGNPTDDGYLTDPETQSFINGQLDPQSYRDLYSIYLNNGYWYYSTPRTWKVSLSYNF